ncbi:MAG: PHP domain-containing protein [Desulfobacteraceae bacterium]|nr:PHP domain-containing protein [Desulfobacteraceae bacterium]MBC2753978.1 PHP domain-containing protein [Desulfobacteraceae bacterium]
MKLYRADMHIHTCLSPCGDWGMSPKAITRKSCQMGLDIIAICDHNTAENAGAVIRAGQKHGITVLPGMEICSKEEVHVLAIFETYDRALNMQAFVYDHLPGENSADLWGEQIVVDENDEVIAENSNLLIGATTLSLYELVDKINNFNGLCIASHIDRPAFGIISNLGFIPDDLQFCGLEVSWRMSLNEAAASISGIGRFPCITSSDAHYIEDVGKVWTGFMLEAPTFAEIRMAFEGRSGRRIVRKEIILKEVQ